MKHSVFQILSRLWLMLAGAGFLPAQAQPVASSSASSPVLTNAAQVLALGPTNAAQQKLPVKLRGVVVGPSRYVLNFSMEDETQAVLVMVNSLEERIPFGNLVEVVGATDGGQVMTENTAFVRASSVKVLQSNVNPPARKATLEEVANYKYYRQWVETEGVVLQTCFEDNEFALHIAGEQGWMVARIRNWPMEHLPTNWHGARVRVQGCNIGFDRKPGNALGGHSTNHVVVLSKERANPFEAPLTNAAALRAGRSTGERFRVQATVLYAGADGTVYLRDGNTAFTSDPLYLFGPRGIPNSRYVPGVPVPVLHPGDVVELVGSPLVESGRLRMRYAQTRVLRGGEMPEPVAASAASVTAGRNADDLVHVSGRLIDRGELPIRSNETLEWMRLESSGDILETFLESRGAGKLASLKKDDLIEVTGLAVPSEGNSGMRLRLRSANDARSVGLAPGVERVRRLRNAGVVGFLVAGAAGWIIFLRYRLLTQQRVDAQIRKENLNLEERVQERTSELEKAKAELARALEQERELSELKSRFVSMVSHEFRTPLGITMSAVELLRNYSKALSEEKRRELFEDIYHSTRNMAGLMEQVLLLGRVEAGKLAFRQGVVDVEVLCQKLVDESRSATNERCPVVLAIEPDLPLAQGDEALLRHILSNLLSNAVKYSPEGKPVRMEAQRDGENVVFQVQDEGIGIPENDLPRLFEPFFRGGNVGETPGTGLGLLIVKRCVELHGGTIKVDSRVGEGTTFTVRVPVFREGKR